FNPENGVFVIVDFQPDGIVDSEDNCPWLFNPDQLDSDGDGLGDICETVIGFSFDVNLYPPTDPNVADTDGDGVLDGPEVLLYGSFPTTTDTDGDGLDDGAEIALGTHPGREDTDFDLLSDDIDTCPLTPSPDNSDLDSDGIGDICDEDDDNDGLSDEAEEQAGSNPKDPDTDDDSLDDFTEVRITGTDPTKVDTDADNVTDSLDNCPVVPNPKVSGIQSDFDADGAGDRCDCDPLDPDARFIPAEILGLDISSDPSVPGRAEINWPAFLLSPGDGNAYDLIRGNVADLSTGQGFSQAECLLDLTPVTSATDDDVPAAGEGFYYAVRAEVSCGTGPFGSDTSDNERLNDACFLTVPSLGDQGP
ncbi:MAG: thrombospondin type 3 repeat-containing protein, partial [Acidobacteriota bacterium]